MDPLKKWHSLLAHASTHTHTHTVIASLHYLADVRGRNAVDACECIEK